VRKLVLRRPFRFKKLDAISAEKSWRLWRNSALSRTGRERKIGLPEPDSKLLALVSSSVFLSIARVRRQLAQIHQIHLSYTTLRRYLKLLGYLTKKGNSSDQTSIGPELPSPEKEWTDAWPDVYGESLADYLAGRRSRTKTAVATPLRGSHPFSSQPPG